MSGSTLTGPQARASWHDAYDAQMALWRFYRTEKGQAFMRFALSREAAGLNRDTWMMLQDLYEGESKRLIDCDPIWVSREMCEVVEAAYPSFQPEPLLETDIITPRGFLRFEKPFDVIDREGEPTNIAGLSWQRTFHPPEPENLEQAAELRAAAFGITSEPGPEAVRRAEDMLLERGARVSGISLTVYQEGVADSPPLLPLHLTPWWLGMTFDGNEWDQIGKPTGAEWWWRITQTTFRLMQQKIAVKHQHRPDRAARREAARLRFPDEHTVVVVRLRREKSEPHEEHEAEPANYSHRFIVSGHWRNQWYPSIQDHRQIWISPYVKGDPGLPLIVKPRRVFQWNR